MVALIVGSIILLTVSFGGLWWALHLPESESKASEKQAKA